MQSPSTPNRSLTQNLLINFLAPLALLATAGYTFISLGTVEPPKRPDADTSRAGRLRALPPIRIEPIERLDTEKTPLFLEVDGTVVPFEEANVAAEVSGRILTKTEKCEAGSYVNQGDLLMEIDPEDYELEVQRLTQQKDQEYQRLVELDQQMLNSQRLIDVAEQDVEIQKKEIARLKALPDGFASQSEIDQASRSQLSSRQQLVTLQNQLDLQKKQRSRIEASEKLATTQLRAAEVNLRRTKIVAPIDGIVVNEQADLNTFVTRGSPLFTIENTSKVEVSTSLRMDQLYWILDQNAAENIDPTSSYDLPATEAIIEYQVTGRRGMVHRWKGRLLSYDGIGLDPRTRTVPIRVIVDEPSQSYEHQDESSAKQSKTPLVRGMFVQVRLLIRPKTQLYVIPTKALQPGNRIYQFTPDETVLEPTRSENSQDSIALKASGDHLLGENSDFKPKEFAPAEFAPEDWLPGRVHVRKEVIPVNSLTIGNFQQNQESINKQTTKELAIKAAGKDSEFWVCEVVGFDEDEARYVVTSPLGTVNENSFNARAERLKKSEAKSTSSETEDPSESATEQSAQVWDPLHQMLDLSDNAMAKEQMVGGCKA
ncbi:MAG: HlyD family efflux transporter periplasmic adaptor subunit [Planctomycetota bacterium]|nr:HlyD family efflux transporter periplasmic adaptor subunit [Planctomycetota bacterium]